VRQELLRRRGPDPALRGALDDRRGQRVLAPALEARGDTQKSRLVDVFRRRHVDQPRPSLGERPRLVEDQRVDPAQLLDRLGVAEEHARGGAAAHGDRDRHRRCEAERAGAGDDQHRHRVDEGERQPRLGPEDGPHQEGDGGHPHDDGHEHGRHAVGEALDRRSAALGLGDQRDDAREQGVVADLFGPHHQASGAVHAAAHHAVPRSLRDRDRLAREIDSSTALAPRARRRRRAAAGRTRRRVPDGDTGKRHVDLAAALARRRVGGARPSSADRGARPAPGAQLEHLPEQHQRHDHGGRLEIHRNPAAMGAEGSRIQPGREGGEQAVAKGGSGAERDQREHVELPRPQRAPAPLEERLSAPEHDGRREQELDPRERPGRQRVRRAGGRQHLPHREREERRREQSARPEAAAHVEQLGALLVVERRGQRLERHAADRTVAGSVAHDLGVHRAGEAGGRGLRRRRRLGRRREPARGLGAETLEAAVAAKDVRDAGVDQPPRAVRRDRHSAYGIAQTRGRRGSLRPVLHAASVSDRVPPSTVAGGRSLEAGRRRAPGSARVAGNRAAQAAGRTSLWPERASRRQICLRSHRAVPMYGGW
jgi:hypothetical protein